MEVSTFFKFTHWSPVWFWMPVWSWRRQPLYNLYILKKPTMRWWHAYWPCMWQHELICTLGASLRSVLYGLARTSCRQCHRMTLCLFKKSSVTTSVSQALPLCRQISVFSLWRLLICFLPGLFKLKHYTHSQPSLISNKSYILLFAQNKYVWQKKTFVLFHNILTCQKLDH